MSSAPLSEQMGAMALVDELRQRRMEALEHLDLPRREAEVAERIRAYYKSQGIACDDETVAQGVRAFFEQRLVFEAQPMSLWQRFLGRLVISTAFRFWMLFMLAFVVMFAVSSYNGLRKSASHTRTPAPQPTVTTAQPATVATPSTTIIVPPLVTGVEIHEAAESTSSPQPRATAAC